MLFDVVARQIAEILRKDSDFVAELVASRGGFENWLQIETHRHIFRSGGHVGFERERSYSNNTGRCDFWCKGEDGSESWVELKLCPTNYVSNFGESRPGKAITQNVSGIISDARKLGASDISRHNAVLVVSYPLPEHYSSHSHWAAHLERIRSETESKELIEAFAIPLERRGRKAWLVGYGLIGLYPSLEKRDA